MVNTFVYSVYGQGGGEKHRNDASIAAYRNQWLDALLLGTSRVQLVIALGGLADSAWQHYRATQGGQSVNVTYGAIPTDVSRERQRQQRQQAQARSEERRVGKECRSRWSPYH